MRNSRTPQSPQQSEATNFVARFEKLHTPAEQLAFLREISTSHSAAAAEALLRVLRDHTDRVREAEKRDSTARGADNVAHDAIEFELVARRMGWDPLGPEEDVWLGSVVLQELLKNGPSSEGAFLSILGRFRNERLRARSEWRARRSDAEDDSLRDDALDDDFGFDEEGDIVDEELKDNDLELNYYQIRFILDALARIGGAESIRELVAFVAEDEAIEYYKYEIAHALGSIDVGAAATQLLAVLRSNANPDVRRGAGKILHRLELGQIGISEDGVRYFEQLYDLGVYNNPDNYVHRLTASGQMGIFDPDRTLLGYFDLGDLASDEERIQAKVLDVTIRTLFRERPDTSLEEQARRVQVLREFKERYFALYAGRFFQSTGVRFNNLAFPEQAWFLHYVANAPPKRQEETFRTVERFGENALRSFLSLEYGDHLGDAVLQIGEHASDREARALFAKYAEIVDSAGEVAAYLDDYYARRRPTTEEVIAGIAYLPRDEALTGEIADKLLRRGKDLIASFADGLRSGIAEAERERRVGDMIRELSALEAENLLFLETFRTLKQRGEQIDLEAVRDIELAPVSLGDISGDDIAVMRSLYARNYDDKPVLQRELLKQFDTAVAGARDKTSGSTVYLLRHHSALRGFLRFEEIRPGVAHMRSFNVDPEFMHVSLGMTMFEKVLEQESLRWRELRAACSTRNPVSMRYIELGFVGTRAYNFASEPSMDIEMNEASRRRYPSKRVPQDEIVARAESEDFDEEESLVPADALVVRAAAMEGVPFERMNEGYALTRLFAWDGAVYAVFEPRVEKGSGPAIIL